MWTSESLIPATKAANVKLVKRNFPLQKRERKRERWILRKIRQEARFSRTTRAKNSRASSLPEGVIFTWDFRKWAANLLHDRSLSSLLLIVAHYRDLSSIFFQLTLPQSPGRRFDVGGHRIEYEASDEAGWSSKCVFVVVLRQE